MATKTPGQRMIEAAEEALRHARGEDTGARVTVVEIPDVSGIRKKLRLSQEEFAQRFGVSLGTLRNWEQGLRVPEGPARVLLTVIDREPAAVRRALSRSLVRVQRKRVKAPKKRKQG